MSALKMKQFLAGLLSLSGWYAYQQRQLLRNRALILMYHRVLPDIGTSPVPVQAGMYVTPESLKLQLTYLKEKFNIISLQGLIGRLRDGRSIARCCVLTFDDGWQDNYQFAFPLLCEFDLPATIFLATGFIGTDKWFWPEELAWCISHASKVEKMTLLPASLLGVLNHVSIEDEGVAGRIDRIVESVKQWNPLCRSELVEGCAKYREAVCQGKRERLLLSWDEVREMNDSDLVSFGSHTVSHVMLDQLHGRELNYELTESMEHLTRETGDPLKILGYPNGNFSQEVVEILQECGYRAAVTTARGFVSKTSSLLTLPRIAIHEDVSHKLDLFKWRLFVR